MAAEAVDDEYVVPISEMPLSTTPATGVLANDVLPADLTVCGFDALSTAGVSVVVGQSGDFTYEPAEPVWGLADSFGYTVADGEGNETSATAQVLVSPDIIPLALAVVFPCSLLDPVLLVARGASPTHWPEQSSACSEYRRPESHVTSENAQ